MILAELERIAGRKAANDPYFNESYEKCKVFQRKGIVIIDDEELCHEVIREFPCHAPQCNATFKTLLDFDMHYNSCHQYVCTTCKKSIQNPRLLDIHIQETHDNFFKAMTKKKPMYQCYVLGCETKFWNPSERNTHCITVHKFCKSYRFDAVSTKEQQKEESLDKMDVDEERSDKNKLKQDKVRLCNQKCRMFTVANKKVGPVVPKESIVEQPSTSVNKNSSLMFIPRQVQKSYTKALTKNQNAERNVIETDTMMDLMESLPQ